MNSKNIYTIIFFFFLGCTLFACKKTKKQDLFEGMVKVPAGEFTMGTDEVDEDHKAEMFGIPKPWFVDEGPKQTVYLDTFYIDIYEVTNEHYKKFVLEADYAQPTDWQYGSFPKGEEKFPVTNISLYDALRYAEWQDKSIPTEAEWEKAARGTDGRVYPWGNTFDLSKANLSKSMNNISKKKAVGLYGAGVTPYGAFDMVGNVWEWTRDWYDGYKGNTVKLNEYGKKFKVIRGLSYFYLGHFPDEMYNEVVAHVARSSFREEVYSTTKSPDLGFRCVKYDTARP